MLLEVVDKLVIVSDTQLFLPFGTHAQIKTSRDSSTGLSYSIQIATSARSSAADQIQVSSSGVISTGSTPLTATVFVTDSFKGLNQTVAVIVEVAAVAHISLSPAMYLWPPGVSDVNVPYQLPVGLSAVFKAQLHDASGRSFYTCDSSHIHTRLHRFDVVRLAKGPENCTFTLTATSIGDAVLQVSWKTVNAPSTSYIRIRTVSGITPQLPTVHVGAAVCFHSIIESPVVLPNLVQGERTCVFVNLHFVLSCAS